MHVQQGTREGRFEVAGEIHVQRCVVEEEGVLWNVELNRGGLDQAGGEPALLHKRERESRKCKANEWHRDKGSTKKKSVFVLLCFFHHLAASPGTVVVFSRLRANEGRGE